MKGRSLIPAFLLLLGASLCAPAQPTVAPQLLEQLHHAELDEGRSYKITDLYLHRETIHLHLRHGTLVFFEPVAGRVTGAVFEGTGEVLVLPPDRVERQQLARFTGSPILTESFGSAYLRFTDSTYSDLHVQIRAGRGQPIYDPDFVKRWAPRMRLLNPLHSLRILLDFMESPPVPYFYAAIHGQRLGLFDVVLDDRRPEPVLVGQLRWREGQRYYDVWYSFARRTARPARPHVRATAYRIEGTVTPERELQALCEVDLELPDPRRRVLLFELSRFLSVEEVTETPGTPETAPGPALDFFQNAALSAEEARYRGRDSVAVVLPAVDSFSAEPALPARRTLRFRYHGKVISDVGGGVLFVGARGTWYPRVQTPSLAHYELRLRYPRSLTLVAAGNLRTTHEEGDWKESLWTTEVPLPVAGFNVGNYESYTVTRNGVPVTVFANRQLEPQLAQVVRSPLVPQPLPTRRQPWHEDQNQTPRPQPRPPASPASRLQHLANDVANALAFFTELFGPIPYPELKVTQIPGRFGQGYPGLLYLSTFSFLPANDQARMGLNERSRDHFSRFTPAHETAHQWWGNWVRLPDYRDQWLVEALASYSTLLYLEQQPDGTTAVREWLARYRSDLVRKTEHGSPVDAIGALTLGPRLSSSQSPEGYRQLIYTKGPWILHMLRTMFRDPQTGSDELFLKVLRSLVARASEQPLTTGDFQRQLEAVLPAYADVEETGRLDWFFQQWVYDTGIPRYRLHWKVRRHQKGWRVGGTIEQFDVSDLFTMPVPVYAQVGKRLTRLGTVVVTGEKVSFAFDVKSRPDKVLLDPHLTVLARLE